MFGVFIFPRTCIPYRNGSHSKHKAFEINSVRGIKPVKGKEGGTRAHAVQAHAGHKDRHDIARGASTRGAQRRARHQPDAQARVVRLKGQSQMSIHIWMIIRGAFKRCIRAGVTHMCFVACSENTGKVRRSE